MEMIERESESIHKAYVVHVLMSGTPIKSITVCIIVLTVGFLAFFGKLEHEVTIVFTAIASYVLGTMPKIPEAPRTKATRSKLKATVSAAKDKDTRA
jgi:hypothetical protein